MTKFTQALTIIMKNITLVILAFFFTCNVGWSQDQKKMELGVDLFPNYSIPIVSNSGNTPFTTTTVRRILESWKPSFSANIFGEYRLGEKSTIGFGFGYQNFGEQTIRVTQTGYDFWLVYNFHNLEIPLYYKYKFRNRFYIILGTSTLLHLSNSCSGKALYFDGSKHTYKNDEATFDDFRKFNLIGNFGLGFDYLNTEKISLFIKPYTQFGGFLGIWQQKDLYRYYLSIGISTGIRI